MGKNNLSGEKTYVFFVNEIKGDKGLVGFFFFSHKAIYFSSPLKTFFLKFAFICGKLISCLKIECEKIL